MSVHGDNKGLQICVEMEGLGFMMGFYVVIPSSPNATGQIHALIDDCTSDVDRCKKIRLT